MENQDNVIGIPEFPIQVDAVDSVKYLVEKAGRHTLQMKNCSDDNSE